MAEAAVAFDFQPHPVAEIFPLMTGREFSGLAESIRRHGQRDPIVLCDGMILDGRNRWLACRANGLEPRTVLWDGVGTPLDYVVSVNLCRRHLTMGQRCMIAARMANWEHGGDRKSDQSKNLYFDRVSAQDAATLMDVSRPQVFHARTILQHGTLEEIARADAGGPGNSVSYLASAIRRCVGVGNHRWRRPSQPKGNEPMAEIIDFPNECPRRNGRAARLPDGMTPEGVARKALELRKVTSSVEKVAKQIGVEVGLCRQMMDIVQVADRLDLPPRDAAIAVMALRRMNENRYRIGTLHASIKPIMERLWGTRKGPSRAALEAKRMDQFDRGIGMLVQVCMSGPLMEIPHMTPQQNAEVLADLRKAIEGVKMLISKLERIAA